MNLFKFSRQITCESRSSAAQCSAEPYDGCLESNQQIISCIFLQSFEIKGDAKEQKSINDYDYFSKKS
jgi:hypothetical protein